MISEAKLALADLLRVYTDGMYPDGGVDFPTALFEADRVLVQARGEDPVLTSLRELFELSRNESRTRDEKTEKIKRTRTAVETARKALEGS